MVKNLLELIKAFGEKYNLPDWLVNDLTIIIVVGAVLILVLSKVYNLIKKATLYRNQRLLNKDLNPFFSSNDVDKATRFYISSKYQNVSPSEDEEPGRNYIASAKNYLIPLFLKKVFPKATSDNKYYIILADSGMGKSTMMINLYLSYKNKITLPFSKPKYQIKLFPLGSQNILEEIKKVVDKERTILLLDAFDEDIKAVLNYEERLKDILDTTWQFRTIVITCRTQFFPTEKEVPHMTGYFSHGESGEYKFQKLYLSIFDDNDIKKYLKKRFPIYKPWQWQKYKRAKKIAQKSPNLVIRPMLLSHIEDLVVENRNYNYSYEIYQALINRWIERESSKPGIRAKFGSTENYKKILYSFSKNLAIDMYTNRIIRGGYYISKEDNFGGNLELNLQDIEADHFKLSETERRSKSLLNRNANGLYKFSHKSILEYFIAEHLNSNTDLLLNFDFEGMDAVRYFCSEFFFEDLRKCKFILERQGEVKQDKVHDIFKIKKLIITELNNFNILDFRKLKELKELLLYDNNKKTLYKLYSATLNYSLIAHSSRSIGIQTHEHTFVQFMNMVKSDFENLADRLNLLRRNAQNAQDTIYLLGIMGHLHQKIGLTTLIKVNQIILQDLGINSKNEAGQDIFAYFLQDIPNGATLHLLHEIDGYLKKCQKLQQSLQACKICY